MKKYMITSALPYANGALHLGHLAGAYLPADIYVRYLRLLGKDVVWVCGSDEHGAAITMRAKKEGVSPKLIIDKYHELNKSTFKRLGISFDYFHRTSAPLHHETAQEFFMKLYKKGDEFEVHENEQYYDEDFNQFLADRYIVGECPKCGHDEAYGDQCEKCGSTLSPMELINPRSTLSGKKPVLRTTKHWYFKLDKHEGWLREWIANGVLDGKKVHEPKAWKRHVTGQCMSWLDAGMRPRAITRDLDWGIKVPLEEAEGKVLYVWFDAPIGYISATKQWAKENEKDWEAYWKGEDVELIHFIGKDNIVFHTLVFPAMLKAYGEYNLPKNVPANQFLNFEGRKFSKSKGWGIEQHIYLEEFKDFPNKEDTLRYVLIRNMPESRDSSFTWNDFIDFHDKDLADNLGNFLNRVVVLTNKYYGGEVQDGGDEWKKVRGNVLEIIEELSGDIERFSFKTAVSRLMELSSFGNTYLQEVSPWKLDKDSDLVKESLSTVAQIATLISLMAAPFLPFTAEKIRAILQLPALENGDLAVALEALKSGEQVLPKGHVVGKPQLLFPKIMDRKDHSRLEIIQRQQQKLEAILAAEEKEKAILPLSEKEISFDDFMKMDIRTGIITAARKVKKSNKLLELTIDLGVEKRTVASGIAKHYKPEDIIGREVLLLANLAPRTIMGIESRGMVLMAEDHEGKLHFASVNGVDGGLKIS